MAPYDILLANLVSILRPILPPILSHTLLSILHTIFEHILHTMLADSSFAGTNGSRDKDFEKFSHEEQAMMLPCENQDSSNLRLSKG